MFEYHGWISLRQTYQTITGYDPPPLRLDEIREVLAELADYGLNDLRRLNGEYHVHLAGYPNHGGGIRPVVLGMFRKIGELAPGCYGLLYVHDDEDPQHRLDFRVYRLARGVLTEHADHLLSPVIPVLEDEETG